MILNALPTERPSPYEQWLIETELALLGLDDCKLECDGMTWVISYLLQKLNIPHTCVSGYVKYDHREKILAPHFWIELPLGYVCDFRLRMWFGDEDHIPHGIFKANESPAFAYHGQACTPATLTPGLVRVITDGAIDHVDLPRPPGAEVSHAKQVALAQP